MKKSIKVFITIFIIMMFLTIIGVAYGFYYASVSGNNEEESLEVGAHDLSIEYIDGSSELISSNKGYVFPGDEFVKTFKVENTGTDNATFNVILKDVINEFNRAKDWVYELKEGNTVLASGIFPIDEKAVIYRDAVVQTGQTKTFTLKVSYLTTTESQNEDFNKQLQATIDIIDATTTLNTAEEGTLLYAINRDNDVEGFTTVPGRDYATESVLSSTEDDYGTSYYFRGNVQNNFVTFAGMCWRIVRVQGDGNIKIVLADEDNVCSKDSETGYSTQNTTSAFIADPENQSFHYRTSDENNSSILVYEDSNIPAVLDSWMNGKTYNYLDIADTYEIYSSTFEQHINEEEQKELITAEWCNDMSLIDKDYIDNDGNIIDEGDNLEISYIDMFFGAYGRLENLSTAKPTLKCDMSGLDESVADKYESVIGLLTLDEVALAGSASNFSLSYDHYLTTNAEGYYWTMSPYLAGESWSAPKMGIVYRGGIGAEYINTEEINIRPAVVLRSDVTIQDGGTGTQATPYVIN